MDATIVIRDGDHLYKVSKILFLSDGGFSFFVPYLNDAAFQKSICYRYPVDSISYETTSYGVIPGSVMDVFIADKPVKLSYHFDGFTQLSGILAGTIKSGKTTDGFPKGLAVYTAPLLTPIESGPSIGCLYWGLNKFTQIAMNGETSIKRNTIILDGDAAYFRQCNSETYNSYFLEMFVFPARLSDLIYKDSMGQEFIFLSFPNFECSNAAFLFRVIRLPNCNSFMGLLLNKTKHGYSSAAGYTMSGPTDKRWGLGIICPLMEGMSAERNINYRKDEPQRRMRYMPYTRFRLKQGGVRFVQYDKKKLWIPEITQFDLSNDETGAGCHAHALRVSMRRTGGSMLTRSA
jgi:hypothetical protein